MKLYRRKSNGRYEQATLKEVALAYDICTAATIGKTIGSPTDTIDFLKSRLGDLEHESFAVVFLNNRHQVIDFTHLVLYTVLVNLLYLTSRT